MVSTHYAAIFSYILWGDAGQVDLFNGTFRLILLVIAQQGIGSEGGLFSRALPYREDRGLCKTRGHVVYML